ncbi:MAG: hypothetical protein H7839_12205 [Magnetococcus sp. YQC-5]
MNDEENKAWVTIHLPWLTPGQVALMLDNNLEFLFRLNPFLRVDHWEADLACGRAGGVIRCCFFNEMNGLNTEYSLTAEPVPQGWLLHYDRGWKRCLELCWEPHVEIGTTLTFVEYYHPVANEVERTERLKEVDHSLVPWARAVRRYHRWHTALGWLPPARWYLDWLPVLAPHHRRMARLLIWSSIVEVLLLFLILGTFSLISQN